MMNKRKNLYSSVFFVLLAALLGSMTFVEQGPSLFQRQINSANAADISAPNPFGKVSPANEAVNQPVSNLTLSWNASTTSNVTYQYCLRPSASCPDKKWISVGTNTSVVVSGLTANALYYWQVRAVDAQNNITTADADTMWTFQTIPSIVLPGAFNKLTPADGALNQPVNGLSLTWSASSSATSYQTCYDTVNNDLCDTSWTTASSLSASLSGLAYDTTYYWQVRAVNADGNTLADGGPWFFFQTQTAPPGAFGKSSPANQTIDQALSLTLVWGASAGTGITYQYCLSTALCSESSTWTSAGTNLSVTVSGLANETTYYWQVRALNATATTYADAGSSWRFTTVIASPGAFTKSSPANLAIDQPLSLVLSWTASSGSQVHYEYCLQTTDCTPTSTWQLAGTNTSISISGLVYGTTYNWQVRAVNALGAIYADLGTSWKFTTQIAPPQPFSKLSPGAGSVDQPHDLILQWNASLGASRYYYCLDVINNSLCDTEWVLNDNRTVSAPLNLGYNQTYFWQVYADNTQGTQQADQGTWWSFKTLAASPTDFTKISPANLAIDQPIRPWLYWWISANPENTYHYCIHSAPGCPDNDWLWVEENTAIQVTEILAYSTTYYWQVRATNSDGTLYANSVEWSFTTVKAPPTSQNQNFETQESTPLIATLTAKSNYGKEFALFGSPPPGTLDLKSSGIFTYTPVPHFNGVVTFQFVVSDGYNLPVGPYAATIIVNPVNDPPVLSPISDRVASGGQQVRFWVTATDPDLPYGDFLTYTIDETLPKGASINYQSGLFIWNIDFGYPEGLRTFTFRVTDGMGLSASQVVKITVDYSKVFLPLIRR
jgi:hypothetical protein